MERPPETFSLRYVLRTPRTSTSETNEQQAAESHMSLGNVTATPGDERLFAQAIRHLRRAEEIPGYTLSIYLQQYLNEYGRYVS